MMLLYSWLCDCFTNKARDSQPKAIALLSILVQQAGTAVVVIAGIVGLVCVGFRAGAPGPEDPPGSGIVVRTEVTALWIPRALRDMADCEAGAPIFRSPEALQTELRHRGLKDAWYALTYRGHKVNGEFGELTQIRHLGDAADHLDEFQAVMATAAGSPPRYEGRDFSHARVEVIPDTLQGVDPREAVIRLMAEPVVGEKSESAEGLDSTRTPQ
jgi:hypothetical protein